MATYSTSSSLVSSPQHEEDMTRKDFRAIASLQLPIASMVLQYSPSVLSRPIREARRFEVQFLALVCHSPAAHVGE